MTKLPERSENNSINHLLYSIKTELCKKCNQSFKELGVTGSQFNVLEVLWYKDGITQSEIQRYLGIKASSVSNLIDHLEKKELIERVFDENDSRVKLIYLTKKGLELKEKGFEKCNAQTKMILSGFSDEEESKLKDYLKRLISNLGNE
ncbi:MarR family winged helix-turn-helix transcriptional regulator [Methanococcus voltae]|uniref:DNA-binding MarR family transcriptional regulator n=2 Tax=Methanococcus voltae TaxID=2188 RepID=A0A8J7RNM7_METVO|nr:MarR family transcriptional regulator [Methanococcus voltae]MBP2172609.1 DNA-binding MarR family transcriptional regulator [Methanococcus voltae]MBP2201484.1 DNA-binding MarR family transcriptional regulator [Methanococcus voltae]MCS3922273.1 DNA-binding MarR family transcriptional regulator [Methanococcus voltae PS]